jgi:hypothetical protein
MRQIKQLRWMRWLVAGLLLFVTGLAGCNPVAWLPDSSGFVYTDGRDLQKLMHYDIAKGQSRVLVEKLPAKTAWPAVGPDGKQIAVARLAKVEGQRSQAMQVILYDLQGKEMHRSAEISWTKEPTKDDDLIMTGVFWVPKVNKLLVHDFEDRPRTGIYDPEKKTMQIVEGMPAAFGDTPVLPNGKGFLVTHVENNEVSGVFVVDWDGKEVPLAMKPETLDSKDKRTLIQAPWTGTSGWDKDVASVTSSYLRIRIDTGARSGAFEAVPMNEAVVDGKEIVQNFAFGAGGAKVRVLRDDQAQNKFQLEVIRPGAEKPRLLRRQDQSFIMSPAPNQKWLAIRSFDNGDIFLVSHTGDVKEIAASD